MSKNIKLNIYLLNSNLSNFNTYMKEEYRGKVKRHYVDKSRIVGNNVEIEKGLICVYEELMNLPEWVDYLNTLSGKNEFDIPRKKVTKAILFLTVKGTEKRTFAITFGHGSSLLDWDYVVSDFGYRVCKSLLSIEELTSIDSMSVGDKMFNMKKQSVQYLIPEKLLDRGIQNVIKNVYGTYKENFNKKFFIGGKNSLIFSGDFDLLNDLINYLNTFANLYVLNENKLGIPEDLIAVTKKEKAILDQKLGEKILSIISVNPITRRQINPLRIIPSEAFNLDDFNGFFISGLGYKSSDVTSDFYIDELNFFERFKRQLTDSNKRVQRILSKIKTDKIYRKTLSDNELKEVCSIYESINYDLKHDSKSYMLIAGKWYEIDKDFYSNLQKDIDAIDSMPPNSNMKFINFDSTLHFKTVNKKGGNQVRQLDEGKYNECLTETNCSLMLDRQDYNPDIKVMKKLGLKTQSSIEICDIFNFDDKRIEFIHVKRHSGGASGTSHLLTQSLVSAKAFVHYTQLLTEHINVVIDTYNSQPNLRYSIRPFKYNNQEKHVILGIVDKKSNIKKPNSKLLSLLEMISLRENVRTLEEMGFKCYLKFIPSDK